MNECENCKVLRLQLLKALQMIEDLIKAIYKWGKK
jgi:hypothetical protein